MVKVINNKNNANYNGSNLNNDNIENEFYGNNDNNDNNDNNENTENKDNKNNKNNKDDTDNKDNKDNYYDLTVKKYNIKKIIFVCLQFPLTKYIFTSLLQSGEVTFTKFSEVIINIGINCN